MATYINNCAYEYGFETSSVDGCNGNHSIKWMRKNDEIHFSVNFDYMSDMSEEIFKECVDLFFLRAFRGIEGDRSPELIDWIEAHRDQ